MIYLGIYLIGLIIVGPILQRIYRVSASNGCIYQSVKDRYIRKLEKDEKFMSEMSKYNLTINDMPEKIFKDAYYMELKISFYTILLTWPVSLIAVYVTQKIKNKKGEI